jgi:hypothetical protein
LIRSKLLTVTGESGGGDPYIGERQFLQSGLFTWKVPLQVTRIHVCAVGAGGYNEFDANSSYDGGGGGGLVWANDIAVVPGEELLIKVGHISNDTSGDKSDSIIGIAKSNTNDFDKKFVTAYGGDADGYGSYDLHGNPGGGGRGGTGNRARVLDWPTGVEVWGGSGGGAGGYGGNGGSGSGTDSGAGMTNAGSGGAGAGGTRYWRASGASTAFQQGSGGGGVGVKGAGSTGPAVPFQGSGENPLRGNPGSNGTLERYGAGGAGLYRKTPEQAPEWARAGGGAVRIIWGIRYSYPNNADVSQ